MIEQACSAPWPGHAAIKVGSAHLLKLFDLPSDLFELRDSLASNLRAVGRRIGPQREEIADLT